MPAVPLPEAFEARMRELLGPEAEALLRSLDEPRPPGLRLNPLRGPTEDLAARLPWPTEPLPWCGSGRLVLAPSHEVAAHPLNDAGAYYQQDPAAMAVAEAVAPAPGELVVDLAAAPGGKTTHLAGLAGDAALVVANDVDEGRARSLLGNVERLGVTGAVVTSARPDRLAAALGGSCDAVLLDAPCSGEGMFRRSDAAREAWTPGLVVRNAELQRRLALTAADLLRPGGRLVYSTCTFDPKEDEEVVLWLLERRPDLEPDSLNVPGADATPRFGLSGAARFWPHLARGDGHFVARLRRREDAAPLAPAVLAAGGRRAKRRDTGLDRGVAAAWEGFAASHLTPAWRERLAPERLARYGDRVLLLPDGFAPVPGVHVLRAGLHVADVRTERGRPAVSPAHALAMAAGFAASGWAGPRLELSEDDAALVAIRAGREVPAPVRDGPTLVTYHGLALGWAACRGGSARSLLPRGLRR